MDELPQDWKRLMKEEITSEKYRNLKSFVKSQYSSRTCYPPDHQIFYALEQTPIKSVKVVIIGQDPYHQAGQAHGLAFSVVRGVKTPPSLVNIYKELKADVGKPVPDHGNLDVWADQGVLLLNSILTVAEGEPGSHSKKGWEWFTDSMIRNISKNKEHVVFMLWGGYAKKKAKLIDDNKHLILTMGHPSPLSANRGYWFGNKHFSQANTYLMCNKQSEILW